MYLASDVFHQIPNNEKPNPVANANTITTGSGARNANAAPIIGQPSASSRPVRSGRAGRQRIATSAPTTAPAPARLSSKPNTPTLP
jgi:hypothetical protein